MDRLTLKYNLDAKKYEAILKYLNGDPNIYILSAIDKITNDRFIFVEHQNKKKILKFFLLKSDIKKYKREMEYALEDMYSEPDRIILVIHQVKFSHLIDNLSKNYFFNEDKKKLECILCLVEDGDNIIEVMTVWSQTPN